MSGDGYANPAVGGGGLIVRELFRSIDYTGLGSATGWGIWRNGLAELLDVVIRGVFRSANYVPGVSGFSLDGTTGTAEINNLTARGNIQASTLDVGPGDITIATLLGTSAIRLFSHAAGESSPARVANLDTFDAAAISRLELRSTGGTSGGAVLLWLDSVQSSTAAPGKIWAFGGHPDGVTPSEFILAAASDGALADFVMRIRSAAVANLASTAHPVQIGLTGGTNLIADRNSLMVRNNGAAAELNLNEAGGNVHCGSTLSADDMPMRTDTDANPRSTTSTTYTNLGTANVTGTYPPNGRMQVCAYAETENSAGGSSFISFEIRDTNSGGTQRVAAADSRGGRKVGTGFVTVGRPVSVSGLPASGTFFARPMFRAGSNTANFDNITIHVTPGL